MSDDSSRIRLLVVSAGCSVVSRSASRWLGLSAETFYDPDAEKRGPGVFAILKLIELAANEGLPWVYLGYWLPDHPKMDYKRRFRPLEILTGGKWRRLQSREP